MTKAELRYMMAIDKLYDGENGVKLMEIATELSVTKVSVYRAMARLESSGYIERDESNKVVFTAKGRQAVDSYKTIVDFFLSHLKRHCDAPTELAYQDALGVAAALSKEICAFISAYQAKSMHKNETEH